MFGLGLSRYVPRAIRPHFLRIATAVERRVGDALAADNLRAKLKPAPVPYRGGRVAVVGFINATTGLGRGARLMADDFKQQGLTVAAFDAEPLVHRRARVRQSIVDAIEAFAPTDIVLHINPPVMRAAVRRLPRHLILGASVVGYWAWELNRLPGDWAHDAALCDAIWTPSRFVADAVRASLPAFRGDVRVMPHAIDRDPFVKASGGERAAARLKLGLPSEAFVAGYAFTMAANFTRKNPLAAILAFQRAFQHEADAPAYLLLRCTDASSYPPGEDALKNAAASDGRIRLLDREQAPLLSFYQSLDVYLSLHRSEGYGLQLVEALQTGADVVATGWSIGDDIAKRPGFHAVQSAQVPVRDPQGVYSAIPGATWAEPDIADAAALLGELARAAKIRS